MIAPSPNALRSARAGVSAVALLIALPVLLTLVGLVLYVGLLRDVRQEAQHGADAAALAGARMLADDSLLLVSDFQSRMVQRVHQARQMSQTIGQLNFAGDQRLSLDSNEQNNPQGDIVIGQLDEPLRGTFTPLPPDAAEWDNSSINAVRVTVRRAPVPGLLGGQAPEREVAAQATAMLDWRVVGFRPRNDQPLPLVPIALYTDHSGTDPSGWTGQWQRRLADLWRYDAEQRRWQTGSDGLPEVVMVVGTKGNSWPSPAGPALFLQIGVEDFGGTMQQLRDGVRRWELERQFGAGGFVLRRDNKVEVPGRAGLPPAGSRTRAQLLDLLEELAANGEPRLWPLFSDYDVERGQVQVSGWTAARVASVRNADEAVVLVLQPCVLPHPAAVTERREPPPAFWRHNRMVCRVRLAE